FFLDFSYPINAELTRVRVTGTINNDDIQPQLLVDDIVVTEGNEPRTATFTFRLSEPTGQTVAFDYSTTNGTALVGFDYVETYGSVTISPGQTNATVTVALIGDTISE